MGSTKARCLSISLTRWSSPCWSVRSEADAVADAVAGAGDHQFVRPDRAPAPWLGADRAVEVVDLGVGEGVDRLGGDAGVGGGEAVGDEGRPRLLRRVVEDDGAALAVPVGTKRPGRHEADADQIVNDHLTLAGIRPAVTALDLVGGG